ncbi:hypothetical protein AB0C13_23130 [Streptomyces sp. NPDC049099]|uniref:hypothetical protein n=1 Tax=Streptomyces sp. NPDC049099 TaxID=3155768 RepID=UPI003423A166
MERNEPTEVVPAAVETARCRRTQAGTTVQRHRPGGVVPGGVTPGPMRRAAA